MAWEEVCISFLIGLLSGAVSGLLVYFLTKNRERKYRVYAYWENFLFNAIGRFGIYVPAEELEYVTEIGGSDSKWRKAMDNVMDVVYKPNVEKQIVTDEEEKLFVNVGIALDELHKWANANKLDVKKRK